MLNSVSVVKFRKRGVLGAVLILCVLGAVSSFGVEQEDSHPLSKREILLLLKQAREHQILQGDIAAEVEQRGIAFTLDRVTVAELERAGARAFLIDALRRAGEVATKPVVKPPQAAGQERATQEPKRDIPDGAVAQESLLERARQHALEYAKELPNFIVTQEVTRYARMPGKKDWQLQDTLEVELTYRVDEGEHFKLSRLNGASTKLSYDELGGSTSTGEFGSMLVAVFAPQSQAEFKQSGHESFRSHSTVVYDFKVRTVHSVSHISDKNSGRTVTSGYNGSVWIDVETKRVLRIEQSHDDIPRDFPISLAENAVEYDWVTIGGERYLLPVQAEILLGRDSERYYSRNVIEFRNYRKFEGDLQVVPSDEPPK
jgi:hypothetical protein